MTANILHRLPSFQLVVSISVGLDHIDLLECRRRSISVANAGQAFSEDCVDLAVGLLIDVLRRIFAADWFVRAGLWPIRGDCSLRSKLGANSDSLIICCALTDETHHMINKKVMKGLGKERVIINVGRGAVIDGKELVQCLVQREIGGVGLDVFENEFDVPKELITLGSVVLSH